MCKFDRDRALQIMTSGTNEQKAAFVTELANMLDHKPYGLVWEHGGMSEDSPFEVENVVREYDKRIPYPFVRKDLSTSLDKANGNMLLEGDNYIWLKVLEQTYAGKVDVIYIDPPYNTGKKDFKYNDRFVGEDDIFRHSKWIDFMHKRLMLARNLLTDDGVIFISCDDHEQANLKILCDEIFGSSNFIAQLVWQQGRHNDAKLISVGHEYILVFAKDIASVINEQKRWREIKPGIDEIQEKAMSLWDEFHDEKIATIKMKAWFKSLPTDDPKLMSKHYNHVDSKGAFFPDNISWPNNNGNLYYELVHPITGKPVKLPARGWRYKSETMQALIDADRVYFGDNENKVPNIKRYIAETATQVMPSVFSQDNRGSSKLVRDMLCGIPFDNPKHPAILARLFSLIPKQNALILDFFAGSGSTAHAVEELNKEDGGSRTWILVTNNEDQDKDDNDPETGICRDITKPRIDTVITGTRPDGSQYSDGCDSGYAYYQYRFISRVKHLYDNNASRFFCPGIVDGFIQLKYGVHRVVQDDATQLCVYENAVERVIVFFGDVDMGIVSSTIGMYHDDDKSLLVLLAEDKAGFDTVSLALTQDGVKVDGQRSIIRQARYLQ